MITTADDIAAIRLVAQQLVASDATEPGDVVRNLLAMQAQNFSASQWWRRCNRLTTHYAAMGRQR
jgi:hypothetical protein